MGKKKTEAPKCACAICGEEITTDHGHYVALIKRGKKWSNIRFCPACNAKTEEVAKKIQEAA